MDQGGRAARGRTAPPATGLSLGRPARRGRASWLGRAGPVRPTSARLRAGITADFLTARLS